MYMKLLLIYYFNHLVSLVFIITTYYISHGYLGYEYSFIYATFCIEITMSINNLSLRSSVLGMLSFHTSYNFLWLQYNAPTFTNKTTYSIVWTPKASILSQNKMMLLWIELSNHYCIQFCIYMYLCKLIVFSLRLSYTWK